MVALAWILAHCWAQFTQWMTHLRSAWLLAHCWAPLTPRMTCFCSYIVIHTSCPRHFYYQLWKWVTLNCFVIWKKKKGKISSRILHFEMQCQVNPKLLCDLEKKRRRGKYHSNPSLLRATLTLTLHPQHSPTLQI